MSTYLAVLLLSLRIVQETDTLKDLLHAATVDDTIKYLKNHPARILKLKPIVKHINKVTFSQRLEQHISCEIFIFTTAVH